MAKRLQHRGGTTSQHSTFTGAVREVTVDTDKNTLVVHDGATAGGHPLATTTNFTSTGIDDNATSTALTINSANNATFSGIVTADEFNLSTSGDIHAGSTASQMTIAGGSNSNVGSNVSFYGSTHASLANVVRFRANASETMRIDSSGNVGIGTSSPSTILHINQGGEPPAEGMLILQANSTTRQLRIQPPTDVDNGFIDIRGGNLTFLDDGTEIFRLQGGGSVGINSSSVSATLDVRRVSGTNGLIQTFGQPTHGVVGAIGNTSVDFYITNNYSGSTDRAGIKLSNNNKVIPMENDASSDNVTDLGSTTSRWKDLYLGGGLYVGGTASANRIYDFEEGVFEPTLTPQTSGSVTIQSGTNELKYTKISGQVFIQGRLTITGSSSPVGSNLLVGNLPFTPSAFSEGAGWFGGMCAISFDGSATFSAFPIWALDTNVKITTTVASINSNTRIHFNFFYYTTA
jgi:hypothetical protein